MPPLQASTSRITPWIPRAKVRVRVGRWSVTRRMRGGARRVKLPHLRPGRYRAVVTAVDAGGNRAVPKRKRFIVQK